MNLYFDARWTRTDYHDGISRYTSGLLEGCQAAGVPVTAIICNPKQKLMIPQGIPTILVNHPVSLKEFTLARRPNKLDVDIVFSPLQVFGFLGRKFGLILTLQDIIYYKHPKPPTNLPWHVRLAWRLFHMAYWPQRLLLNRADSVATVSATSKKYIQELQLTQRRVDVIYNAPSREIIESSSPVSPEVAALLARPSKKILYMGSFMPYKNSETLIAAMEFLPQEYELVLLSKISPDRKKALLSLCSEGAAITFLNGVSEADYARLLAVAHCLASASKEEGFGLPIVEAQTRGVPVVCSDLAIFHEVTAGSALICPADSAQDFATAIQSLNSKKLWQHYSKAGIAQSAQFTWEASAQQLAKSAGAVHRSIKLKKK